MPRRITPADVYAASGKGGSNSVSERLHITGAAIAEGLRLQAIRKGRRCITLREDDNLA